MKRTYDPAAGARIVARPESASYSGRRRTRGTAIRPPGTGRIRPVPGGRDQRRLNVTWVTPLGLLTDSIRKWSSSPSRPSHSPSPRPSTMGTTTTCR